MINLVKKAALASLLLISMQVFASNCDGSKIMLINNTDFATTIDVIHQTNTGTLGGIEDGQIIAPHSHAIAVAQSQKWSNGDVTGIINLTNELGRIIISYDIHSSLVGLGSCTIDLDAELSLNDSNLDYTSTTHTYDGKPAFASHELNVPHKS